MENKVRSSSKGRIIDAAFANFIDHGYEGASLSVIADTVGIRKASIYTHFPSKDALFLELLNSALALESGFLSDCFDRNATEALPGEAYCHALQMRYNEHASLRFLIRMTYVPPKHLTETIITGYLHYIEMLKGKMRTAFLPFNLSDAQLELYSDAYLGILDGLGVELINGELLYGELFYQRRLNALLMLYRNSLHNLKNT